MLTMTEVDDIREAYFREGESISAIAKRFSKDRKTVRKYIDKEDFNCSYRTVASYVHKRKKALCGTSKGTLPLVHRAGEAQVDFGEAEFYENGTLWRGKYLNVSFTFSNAGYLQLFK